MDRTAFYTAAVLGLRALDAREPQARRFGEAADARWARFRGALHEGDRLELLLRDGAATWGAAFAPAQAFRLPGVALDEPIGAAWISTNAVEGARHLAAEGAPSLAACAQALGVEVDAIEIMEILPTTRLALAGGRAILSAARAFLGRDDLDWTEQVTVFADRPAHRQLAGLAAVFLNARGPCALLASDEGGPRADALRVVSPDAEPACAALLGA